MYLDDYDKESRGITAFENSNMTFVFKRLNIRMDMSISNCEPMISDIELIPLAMGTIGAKYHIHGERIVVKISLSLFQYFLVEHVDIRFRLKNVKQPTGKKPGRVM